MSSSMSQTGNVHGILQRSAVEHTHTHEAHEAMNEPLSFSRRDRRVARRGWALSTLVTNPAVLPVA